MLLATIHPWPWWPYGRTLPLNKPGWFGYAQSSWTPKWGGPHPIKASEKYLVEYGLCLPNAPFPPRLLKTQSKPVKKLWAWRATPRPECFGKEGIFVISEKVARLKLGKVLYFPWIRCSMPYFWTRRYFQVRVSATRLAWEVMHSANSAQADAVCLGISGSKGVSAALKPGVSPHIVSDDKVFVALSTPWRPHSMVTRHFSRLMLWHTKDGDCLHKVIDTVLSVRLPPLGTLGKPYTWMMGSQYLPI